MLDKDFEKLIQLFPTKAELRQELEKIREEMATKDDFRKVMTVLDKVLKEVYPNNNYLTSSIVPFM